MASTGTSQFAAVDASLGYLFQVRCALLWALLRLRNEPSFLVSIETLDDVEFATTGGTPTDLLQTKHHRENSASLSNASEDLWKTLRVWFSGVASGAIPPEASLNLLTTTHAPDGSAAARLRSLSRDVEGACTALDATAQSSTSDANEPAYKVYLEASRTERIAVLDRVTVLDSSDNVTDLDDALQREIFWAVDRGNHAAFLDRLEGWWLRRVIQQLTGQVTGQIASADIEAQMSDLREQFRQDSLPIDDDLLEFTLDEATMAAHSESTFVRQLELAKAGQRRIGAAVRDYYRAFEQRSRWLRDDLLVQLDLTKYEKRLSEEWELIFDAMGDEVGVDASEAEKELAARQVLAWAERELIPIRSGVTEPFLCRGSFHMLSDEIRIGWHPDFRDRLKTVIEAKGSAS